AARRGGTARAGPLLRAVPRPAFRPAVLGPAGWLPARVVRTTGAARVLGATGRRLPPGLRGVLRSAGGRHRPPLRVTRGLSGTFGTALPSAPGRLALGRAPRGPVEVGSA